MKNHELESWMRGMYAALFKKQYAIPSGMDAEAYSGGYAAGSARRGQLEAELAQHRVDSAVARLRLLASSRRENSIFYATGD
jgi:hypothetical protein